MILTEPCVGEPEDERESMTILNGCVEVRSACRVPFEPKCGTEEMKVRSVIRSAVSRLKAKPNEILVAEFEDCSDKREIYDIENVLFYNIGSACFRDACRNGVVFSDADGKRSGKEKAVYRYGLKNSESIAVLSKAAAEWKDIAIGKVSASRKPAHYWNAMKANWDSIIANREEVISERFGIRIHVTLPEKSKINIAAAMKPMLDGVICAFHRAEGDLSEFCDVLSCTKEQLVGDEKSILPARQYIRRYPKQSGVKWDPEDNKCRFVFITLSYENVNEATFSGKIFKI